MHSCTDRPGYLGPILFRGAFRPAAALVSLLCCTLPLVPPHTWSRCGFVGRILPNLPINLSKIFPFFMIFPIFPILFAEQIGEVGLKPKPVEASCHAALESQHRGHDHGHCGCRCLCDSSSAVQGVNESRVFRVFRVFSFQVLYLLCNLDNP